MEPAVAGLDWPFTTIPKSKECFAEQQPFGPPSLVRATSSCPGIDRPASGFNAVTKGPIKTSPHTKKCYEESASLRIQSETLLILATTIELPGPCFKTDNTTLVHQPFILQRHHCLFTIGINPYRPHLAITIWFQNLFTPQQGFFSAFPHGTKYAIGLEMYLGLGVDATQIQTQYPMHPTQEYIQNHKKHILTGLSPSTVLPFQADFSLVKGA